MIITATTDGQFVGKQLVYIEGEVFLDNNVIVKIEKTMSIPNGTRYIASSYIIDAQEN